MLVGRLIVRGNKEKYKNRHNLNHIPTWGHLVLERAATFKSNLTILCKSLIYLQKAVIYTHDDYFV